ncbi:hypothetical protein K440DRAFT_640242 [Wilcoxina mikolae CBS 423.85]|nr:hypothetical protein K440DRAFT_640242 [Wilcoxina mikolae CBS 423.85]
MILEYLTKQNRPYSATVTAAKILKEMHESGQIEGRVSGKQVVYHVIQDPKESVSEEELKAMDEEIEDAALRQEATALKAQFKDIQASLSSLKSTPSISSLNDSVAILDPEVRELEEALATLQAGATKPVDPVQKAAAEVEYKRIEKVYLKRQKQFKEFWAVVCDMNEGDPAELWETLGLDGDL